MMMNGELMQDALSGKPGSFLADCIEQARHQARAPEVYMVNQIYLAALSRYPTAQGGRSRPGTTSRRTPTRSRCSRTCSGPCSTPTSSS